MLSYGKRPQGARRRSDVYQEEEQYLRDMILLQMRVLVTSLLTLDHLISLVSVRNRV